MPARQRRPGASSTRISAHLPGVQEARGRRRRGRGGKRRKGRGRRRSRSRSLSMSDITNRPEDAGSSRGRHSTTSSRSHSVESDESYYSPERRTTPRSCPIGNVNPYINFVASSKGLYKGRPISQIGRDLGARWRALSLTEREPFILQARRSRAQIAKARKAACGPGLVFHQDDTSTVPGIMLAGTDNLNYAYRGHLKQVLISGANTCVSEAGDRVRIRPMRPEGLNTVFDKNCRLVTMRTGIEDETRTGAETRNDAEEGSQIKTGTCVIQNWTEGNPLLVFTRVANASDAVIRTSAGNGVDGEVGSQTNIVTWIEKSLVEGDPELIPKGVARPMVRAGKGKAGGTWEVAESASNESSRLALLKAESDTGGVDEATGVQGFNLMRVPNMYAAGDTNWMAMSRWKWYPKRPRSRRENRPKPRRTSLQTTRRTPLLTLLDEGSMLTRSPALQHDIFCTRIERPNIEGSYFKTIFISVMLYAMALGSVVLAGYIFFWLPRDWFFARRQRQLKDRDNRFYKHDWEY